MPPVRPNLSITLPRNFQFHYTDCSPRTPEPEVRDEPLEPPQPPRQTYRVRRRRPAVPIEERQPLFHLHHHNMPVPSIEIPDEPPAPQPSQGPALQETLNGFLAPAPPLVDRMVSPPKTPLGQLSQEVDDENRPVNFWEANATAGAEISRPTSACTVISDSSISSDDSSGSLPSFGGSCTSPESDSTDPFTFNCEPKPGNPFSPAFSHEIEQRPFKRSKRHYKPQWTPEMERHLWITYMMYLQDPTLTPFKMLPGTAPPLGVCSRVAREAKKAWKEGKIHAAPQNQSRSSANSGHRAGSHDTVKAFDGGESTPTGPTVRKPLLAWPRSESATRRKLRQLCKRNPSLSAHYQRLMFTRTPSPFLTSPQAPFHSKPSRLSSPFTKPERPESFATQDMTYSLATSTATTMQPDHPLPQLSSEALMSSGRRDGWVGQPTARLQAHQKSQSLQLGLKLNTRVGRRTLNSAFGTMPSSSSAMGAAAAGTSLSSSGEQSSTVPRLAPPFELRAPSSLNRSFKRRAHHLLEDELSPGGSAVRRNFIEELFGAPAAGSHRRVRSRGFSLGDMGEGARRLSTLFTPPPGHQAEDNSIAEQSSDAVPSDPPHHAAALMAPSGLMPPPVHDRIRRLGSPFTERPSGSGSTFPRAFLPPAFDSTVSIEERLAAGAPEAYPGKLNL